MDSFEPQQPNIPSQIDGSKNRAKRIVVVLLVVLLILSIVGLFFLFKTGFTLSKIFGKDTDKEEYLNFVNSRPVKDPSRTNFLLLGLRGESDPYGGLLTDTIMVLSVKNDGRVALISIPRDLYIKMPSGVKKEKINYAYAFGREKLGEKGGLIYSKAAVSDITGLYMDYAIAFDFIAFQKIVDTLGGIIVYLDKPFIEESQFAGEFNVNLPAGKNVLSSTTALYYVRSRYSTSDFDRARRQQQVFTAIISRARDRGILTNPAKIYGITKILGAHLRTDIAIDDISGLANQYARINFDTQIKKKVFDTSETGLLYSSYTESGAFILLPIGDNFDKLREVSRLIFE